MSKVLVGYLTETLNNGVNNYLKTFLEEIKNEDVQIDILTKSKDENNLLYNYVKENGYNNLYHISRDRLALKQLIEIIKIIKKTKYDVAYFNISETYNCVGIIAAKLCGIKKIVVHSHSSGSEDINKFKIYIKNFLNKIFKPVVSSCANSYLACSENAAKWMYPKNIIRDNKYELIYNVVDYDKYKYNENIRKQIRKKLCIEDKFVIGHIGRFSPIKNHKFLIDILYNVLEKRENTYLICVGEGKEFEEIKDYSKKKGVYDKVLFTGQVNNSNEYLQAFDVFILPSYIEGLPIVGIEAQFSGVPYLYSDTITDKCNIGENSKPISINKIDDWVDEILKIEKRENKLLESSKNFLKANSKKQFERILDEDNIVKKEKKFSLNLLFKVIMVVHFILNLTCYYNGFNILTIPVSIILLLILIKNLKNYKVFIKDKINVLLIAYSISYVITFMLTTKYNVMGSAKVLIWMIFHFIFAFMYTYFASSKQLVFEMKSVFNILLICMTIINIYNISLLLNNTFETVISFDNEQLVIGTTPWGRFYGIFYDANYASVVCTVCILYGIYVFKNNKNKLVKFLITLSIIINVVYIFFGQSRSGILSLISGIIVFTIMSITYSNTKIRKKTRKLLIIIPIIILLIIFTSKIVINTYNNLKNNSNYTSDNLTIGRRDSKKDISNRRFDIWKSGFEIFIDNPILGVGFANLIDVANDKYPNTYIVNNDFNNFNTTHNVIIDVMVSQGILGLIILIGIFFNTIYLTFKGSKYIFNSENKEETILILSIIVAILTSSMFLSEIFYINNACTYLFWLSFGYYNYYINKEVSKYDK